MRNRIRRCFTVASLGALTIVMLSTHSSAQETLETRIGELQFTENYGYPTEATAEKLFDEMDFQRASQSYIWALPIVQMAKWQDAHKTVFNVENGKIVGYKLNGEDLDRLPSPYLQRVLTPGQGDGLLWEVARGCPFNCDFCNVTALFGHRPRIKTADQIIAELDNLYRRGWRSQVFFVDDNFIGNKKYLMNQLLPALIEWQRDKKGFLFNTEASINLADNEDLMHTMVEAGFDTVFIGIETPDEESLAECNKLQNKGRDLVARVLIRLQMAFTDATTADQADVDGISSQGSGAAVLRALSGEQSLCAALRAVCRGDSFEAWAPRRGR